ncbi:hypothetical protein C4546_03505 [Candidatus Parcubacteria bacterium]|nr:MAG: hypothetical protein C4546_03505 [Candidatus Parcubacteria bacterium]
MAKNGFTHGQKKLFTIQLFFVFRAKLTTKRQNLTVINTKNGDEIAHVKWVDSRFCTKKICIELFTRQFSKFSVYKHVKTAQIME